MFHSWKFSANAVWEEALSVDVSKPIDTTVIEQWVAQSPQNIAFEAVFSVNGVPGSIFGVRITAVPKGEQVLRIRKMLLRTEEIRTDADFQKIFSEVFPEFILLLDKPEALNIGIVDQWNSVGFEVVWNREAHKPLIFDELEKKAPKFFRPTSNPSAIEFWYTQPVDHWYKIYVSDLHSEGYLINRAKFQASLDRLYYLMLFV